MKLHLRLLSKADNLKYYGRKSRFLLREIKAFERKRERVFEHIDNAIGYYCVRSDCVFHTGMK